MLPRRALRVAHALRSRPLPNYPSRHIPLPISRLTPLTNSRHNSNDSRPPASPTFDLFADAVNEGAWILEYFRRFVKVLLIALVSGTAIAGTAWEGAHLWVEYVALAPEEDPEARKWGWDQEIERWSGTERGTDPELGLWARHAVRSAWTSIHWGTGHTGKAVHTRTGTRPQELGAGPRMGAAMMEGVEFELEFAHDALAKALAVAAEPATSAALHPLTAPRLLVRHAAVLEAMGVRAALVEAREELEQAWAAHAWAGVEGARLAWQLGELNTRLNEREEAAGWLARSIALAQGSGPSASAEPVIPKTLPPSPASQRALASTLVSLSALYATTGQLKQAQTVQESALNLLRTSPQTVTPGSSPAQSLHELYLLHRASLLSVHLAEVLYALRGKAKQSLAHLEAAAQTSERVALALAGLPPVHPDAPRPQTASAQPPLGSYTAPMSMREPARALLRDARRSAAKAWSLIGVLSEERDKVRAMECYERALDWVGVAGNEPGEIGKPGEGVTEAEYKAMWADYVRVREAVRKGKS